MKKYFQITFFLVVFAILVLYRQMKGNTAPSVIGNPDFSPPQNISPLPTKNIPGSGSTGGSNAVSGKYKDGTYTGGVADAYYGNIQVQVTIANGKISDVTFLQYPNDNRTSHFINSQAMPLLKSEAIQAQSAQVDAVSGASQSSKAFRESLSSALTKAS